MKKHDQNYWTINTESLLKLINDKRRRTNKTPIDNGAITTRMALKARAMGLGELDLGSERLELKSTRQIEQLIEAINHLFDLNIHRGEVDRYLAYHDIAKMKEADANARSAEIVEETFVESEGFMTRFKRLFKHSTTADAAH